MSIWLILLIASDIVPLARAIWANRRTTLLHALTWAVAAWAAWLWLAITGIWTAGYVAVCLTACAGVAVLGARRPGVGAWNMVVAGLLAVLMIPLVQEFLTGNSWLRSEVWFSFVIIVLAVGICNYLNSRVNLGVVFAIPVCGFAIQARTDHPYFSEFLLLVLSLAGISPWLAWAGFFMRKPPADPLSQLLQAFRDRFGLVWELRLKEQFKQAAKHRGLSLELASHRIRRLDLPDALYLTSVRRLDITQADESERAAAYEILVALMKRFGLP